MVNPKLSIESPVRTHAIKVRSARLFQDPFAQWLIYSTSWVLQDPFSCTFCVRKFARSCRIPLDALSVPMESASSELKADALVTGIVLREIRQRWVQLPRPPIPAYKAANPCLFGALPGGFFDLPFERFLAT